MWGAIKTITNMVLISLDPFTYRKILLIAAALLGLSAVCFADPVLMAQRYAPNHGGLDAARAGHQSEKPTVVPELGAFDASGIDRDETDWRPMPLPANLVLSPAEASFGLLQRDNDTLPMRFIDGTAAMTFLG
jgi:hypothetical protein